MRRVSIGRFYGAQPGSLDGYREHVDVPLLDELRELAGALRDAFQRGCDLVVQKSLKEGFGLVVSEALWKGKAVVAGNTTGIRMQIPSAYQPFLVDTVEECAKKIAALLKDAAAREAFGEAGRAHVRRHFLLPRLVRDELRLIASLVGIARD